MKILLKPLQLLYALWAGLTFLLGMLIAFPYFYFVFLVFEETRANRYVLHFLRGWGIVWNFLCGYKIEVSGREKIPLGSCYIFISNHASGLDAMVWLYANRHLMKGLAKKEISNIPVLGYLFRKTCVIVERGNKESRQQSMEALHEVAQKNISIIMFPEGTRNKTDKPLQPFYDGAFRIAIDLQKPLAPFVMINTGVLMPSTNFFYKPGTVKCIYLDLVSTEGLEEKDMESLKAKVFAMMEKAILENDERFKSKV